MSKQKPQKGPKKEVSAVSLFGNHLVTILLVFLIIASVYSLFADGKKEVEDITISALAADVEAGLVDKVSIEGNNLTIIYIDETEKSSKKEADVSLQETLLGYAVPVDVLKDLDIEVNDPSQLTFWLFGLLQILIPALIIFAFIWFISRQMKGSTMQAFTFGQSKARIIDPSDKSQRVTFKDVAGNNEAKEELTEIVDFLKNPKKFLDIGARIPKGVLLMGAPGTGKTMLARAVSGEANVPFIYLSGSEFVEMFVGVGASRVRDLFKMAIKIAPAIVFIDEIDAVGRHRGSGTGGGNDEREQTLNQILVEMDGFEPNDKVIVMAATNRPDVLDPALLRPGRFDRRVTLDLPDVKDREAILDIHCQKKPLYEDVDLKVVAERTPGFSGADLANLMNEGAILAARENRKQISQYDLIRSIEKVMLGPERKSHILSAEEKKVTAYHEAGHALVASVLPHADPVHKVTIISRGTAAGYTLNLPLEEKKMQQRKAYIDRIAMSLGGYAAEKMIFGDITTGPSNDISVSTALVRNMVAKYGMSDNIGPVAYGNGSSQEGGGYIVGKPYSEETASALDKEVSRLMEEGLATAERVLNDHRDALDGIANELVEKETLERDEFEKILIRYGIKPKSLPGPKSTEKSEEVE